MTDIDNVNTAGRVGRRLVAIPVAVVAGIVAVFALDSILHHAKGWQMPTIFLGAFFVAAGAGVACIRFVGPTLANVWRNRHPLDVAD
jgi:hypothetical protein